MKTDVLMMSYMIDKTAEERAMKSTGEWMVGIKGAPGKSSFEISVLRKNNLHGIRSYGWFDNDKLLITHNGGPCHWPLIQIVWDAQVKLAYEIAAQLNAKETAKDSQPSQSLSAQTLPERE